MKKRQSYTALIGILGVLFAFTPVQTKLPAVTQFLLGMVGALIFLWASLTLYFEGRTFKQANFSAPILGKSLSNRRITRVELLNEEDSVVNSWDLYQKNSALIGRDYKENQVDIDLGRSEYAALVDIHHAVLNYAEGEWFIEDLGSQNGVSVQKKSDGRKYKISSSQPCKLDFGDIVHIGLCRLRLC